MSKVLFVLTSHGRLGDTALPTGFHLGETVEPWAALRQAGHQVDFASIRGGTLPMIGVDKADRAHRGFLAAPDGGGRLAARLRVDQVDPTRNVGVYLVGGHGAMWDFPGDLALAGFVRAVWESDGVVAAICHGSAGLLGVTLASGRPLVEGRSLTCFSNDSEAARGLDGVMPFALQTALEERGARYSCARDRQSHVVTDERLVTGQNPASAAGVGAAMTRLLTRPCLPPTLRR